MMQRNALGTTIVVRCDTAGCGVCWIYDSHTGATFKGARAAAARAGWTIIPSPADRRDLCRYCSAAAAEPVAAAA